MKTCDRILRPIAVGAFLLSVTSAFAGGLVALYPFNETDSSQPATDSSSNGLNGTYVGGVAPGQPAVLPSGLSTNSATFDGSSGYVLLPQSTLFDTGDLTLEFWMNLNGSDLTFGMPLARGTGNNNVPWTIQIDPVTAFTAPRQLAWIANGSSLTLPAVIQPNVWQHVAIVQSGTQAGVYLNGQPVALGALPLIPQTPQGAILIGRRGDGYYLNGSMDNVAIFNAVLSQTQIQSDMANGVMSGESNLVAVWDFNQTSTSQPAADSSGNGFNGTYEGGVTLVPGPMTNALTTNAAQFNGTTGYVLGPSNAVFNPPNLTVEFWINVSGSNYANFAMPISCSPTNSGPNLPWTVQLNPTTNATTARQVTWAIAGGGNVSAPGALPPDSWHHVAITQAGAEAGRVAQIYVDGVPVGSGTSGTGPAPVFIGKRADGANFNGSLADVAFYNVALSQSQIQNDMSNGVAVGPVAPGIFIYQEPQPTTLQPTMVANFSVAAAITGSNASLFAYQWQKNGTNITGATNSSYITPPVALADNGAPFDCVVSYPGVPSATSAAATLTVGYPNLVALWKFDDATNSGIAVDSSGNGNNGAYNGAYQFVPGVYSNETAVELDGATAYVDFPSTTNFNLQNMTLEFWMNMNGSNINYMMPVARGVNNPWTAQINPVPDPLDARDIRWIVGNSSQYDTPSVLTPNAWHHVAITQLGTTAQTYIDGVLQAQGTVAALPASTLDILVGKRADGYYFLGSMNDVAMFNFPLTQNQILDQMQHGASSNLVAPLAFGALTPPQPVTVQPGLTASFSTTAGTVGLNPSLITYQWQKNGTNITGATNVSYTTPPAMLSDNGAQFLCVASYPGSPNASTLPATLTVATPTLVGLWKFDETGTNQPAADSSGNGDNGIYEGTNCQLAPGLFGNAVLLDANVNDYVDIPSSTNFDLVNYTLEFWMNFTNAVTTYMMPVTRGVNNPWTFQMNPGSGTRSLYWINSSGNISASITPNVWHHVAVTQYGPNASLYVDGNLAAQGAIGLTFVPATNDIYVGKRPDGYPFSGMIEELAMFNGALTQYQIQQQMLNGASSNLATIVPVTLSIQQSNNTVQLSWPSNVYGFALQANTNLDNPANWANVPGGANNPMTLNVPTNTTFYRLKK